MEIHAVGCIGCHMLICLFTGSVLKCFWTTAAMEDLAGPPVGGCSLAKRPWCSEPGNALKAFPPLST